MTVNYPVLGRIMLVVLVVSIVGGYWVAISSHIMRIFVEAGYSLKEIGILQTQRSIIHIVLSYSGSALILITNYYSGKQYRLGKKSVIVFLLGLIVATWIGYLLGYGIRQIEFPEYPILSFAFFFQTLNGLDTIIIWSFLGILAGNYKRALEKQRSNLNYKS